MIRSLFIAMSFALTLSASAEAQNTTTQPQPVKPVYKLPHPENHDKVIGEAEMLGAPMVAVRRALKEAEGATYRKKDVVSVFDLSQDATKKRYYVLDLKTGKTTAYHSSHGKGNGAHFKATSFKGFNQVGSNKTPLGAFRTGSAGYPYEGYTHVRDDVMGKSYSGLLILDIDGVKPYNHRINRDEIWVVLHTKWYATEGYRKKNNGVLGRSLGCIVLDPIHNNWIIQRTQGGSLLYITVGNDSIEKYL